MSKVILTFRFDFYMMHVAKVSDHSYNIVNRNNQFKGMRFRSLQEIRAATSRILDMDSSGTKTCSNSGSIVIAVVSSAKDIILRSKQTVVCLEVHTLTLSTTSQNQRRRAPGSH